MVEGRKRGRISDDEDDCIGLGVHGEVERIRVEFRERIERRRDEKGRG